MCVPWVSKPSRKHAACHTERRRENGCTGPKTGQGLQMVYNQWNEAHSPQA